VFTPQRLLVSGPPPQHPVLTRFRSLRLSLRASEVVPRYVWVLTVCVDRPYKRKGEGIARGRPMVLLYRRRIEHGDQQRYHAQLFGRSGRSPIAMNSSEC
jgi:hypothetical protein